ncbi:MAG: TPM domain-containing protein [Acidobacteria bacterium]|nr:MAG: TPM domain-containing protein [Acidobacteriota bacterium]
MSEPATAPRRRRAAVLLLALLAGAHAAALEVPYLGGRVNDLAEMLSPEVEARLEEALRRHEQATGNQVAVLTIPSLEGENLEDFSIRVVETWQLGRQGVDDGVLLLLARDDRKMRLEVGYGLEPTLTDALASRILNEIMRPRLRQGDADGAVEAGVNAVLAVLSGAELPPPPRRTARRANKESGVVILLLLFPWSFGAMRARGIGALFAFLFLLAFWGGLGAAFFGTPAAVVMMILWSLVFPFGWLFLHKTAAGRRLLEAQEKRRRRRRNGWSSSGGWFSGGGGGFSGGGFSGGGFGGGGSSSSW